MNYQQAIEYSKTVEWKTVECPTKDCLDLMINSIEPIKDDEGNEIHITSGCINRSLALHVVELQNTYVKTLNKFDQELFDFFEKTLDKNFYDIYEFEENINLDIRKIWITAKENYYDPAYGFDKNQFNINGILANLKENNISLENISLGIANDENYNLIIGTINEYKRNKTI